MAFLSTTNIRLPGQRYTNVPFVVSTCRSRPYLPQRAMVTSSAIVERGAGMKLIRAADDELICKLGCRSWPTWGCGPSTFPWTYSDDEVCLVLSGEFTVIPDNGSESMNVTAGDVAYFPKDMSCTWEVKKTVQKHFNFGTKL